MGFDCFHVGRLSGTKVKVWQYTAIDIATSYVWDELHTTPLNRSASNTGRLARRVAAALAGGGGRGQGQRPGPATEDGSHRRVVVEELWKALQQCGRHLVGRPCSRVTSGR